MQESQNKHQQTPKQNEQTITEKEDYHTKCPKSGLPKLPRRLATPSVVQPRGSLEYQQQSANTAKASLRWTDLQEKQEDRYGVTG